MNEINNKTDIKISYSLHKTGKRFTGITLTFSQEKNSNNQSNQLHNNAKLIENKKTNESLDVKDNDQSIIIAAQLQSYGIPQKKALEYVKNYGADICILGIKKLLGEIQKGKNIKNISGYLVSCIENSGNNSNSQEIKASMDAAERLVKTNKTKEIERFHEFDVYINNNEQQILPLFLKHEAKEKIIDEVDIDMLRCLKEVVNQYSDLEKMTTHYLKFKFKDEILNYSKIKNIVQKLEVASKEEKISKLKADLEEKKEDLKNATKTSKKFFEKEITMLKLAIADLI